MIAATFSACFVRMCRAYGEKRALYGGFLCSGLLVLLVLVLLPVRYETNDDVGFLSYFGGGAGSFDVFFLSQIFNISLRFLYGMVPSFPWYGVFIYLALWLGVGLMWGVLLRQLRGSMARFFSLSLLGLYSVYCLCFLNFTSATLLLGFGVSLSVFERLLSSESFGRTMPGAWLLWLCAVFAYAVRWRLFFVLVLFSLPMLFFVRRRGWVRVWGWVVLLVLLVVCDVSLYWVKVGGREAQAFRVYSGLRAQFHDTLAGEYRGKRTRQALEKAGWSFDDFALFHNWVLYDQGRFGTRALRLFLRENAPRGGGWWVSYGARFRKALRYNADTLTCLFVALLGLLLLRGGSLGGMFEGRRRRLGVVLGVTFLGFLGVTFFRFVPRVAVPMSAYLFGLICVCLFHREGRVSSGVESLEWSEGVEPPPKRLYRMLAWVSLCVLLLSEYKAGEQIWRWLSFAAREKSYITGCLRELYRQGGRRPILVMMGLGEGHPLGLEYLHPLKGREELRGARLWGVGWDVGSARYRADLQRVGAKDGLDFLRRGVGGEVLLVHFSRDVRRHRELKRLWESFLRRRVFQGRRPRLLVRYSFLDRRGLGLVFYGVKVDK